MSVFDQICSVVASDFVDGPTVNPQYQPPQQRPSRSDMTWVGLTDEEIYTESRNHEKWAKDGSEWFSRGSFARAIEAKLKEKNT